MISHVHGPCVLLGTTQGQLRKSIKSISKRDINVGDWVGLSTRINWAQAVKYGYHLHIDGIVVTDPFKSNLPTMMSSAIVSERQHIVNLSLRDHFSLVLCYYWVVWISPLLSYHCWFFPLQQHGFFGLNSKLHLGLVFEIGFCFLSKIHSSIKSVAMLLFFIYTPKRRGPFFRQLTKNWLTKINKKIELVYIKLNQRLKLNYKIYKSNNNLLHLGKFTSIQDVSLFSTIKCVLCLQGILSHT